VNYLFVFNPKAKRYSRHAEATLLAQAARMLPNSELAVVHTVPSCNGQEENYTIDDFERQSRGVDCVVAVGGDGTINIVVNALMRSGMYARVPLGLIPYGTGNNLVRSYSLARDHEKALVIIRDGHMINLDIGLINRQRYFVNASFGLFPHIIARRVTTSRAGWTYDALRHLGFTPWTLRLRYMDGADRVIELPSQRYIVGTLLNTSHYGSIMHMAPDAISDDGLFDVKLIRETSRLAYPLILKVIMTGQYDLLPSAITFRTRRIEVLPDVPCQFETDGDVIPLQPPYTVEMAGSIRLIVPAP
jgi:diacylglycerol kinase (ATP)